MENFYFRSLEDVNSSEYLHANNVLIKIGKQSTQDINRLTSIEVLNIEWDIFTKYLAVAVVNSGKLTRWVNGLVHEFPNFNSAILNQDLKNYFRLEAELDGQKIVAAVPSQNYVLGKISWATQEFSFYSLKRSNHSLFVLHTSNLGQYSYDSESATDSNENLFALTQFVPKFSRSILPVLFPPEASKTQQYPHL